jgi:hypothetical protein
LLHLSLDLRVQARVLEVAVERLPVALEALVTPEAQEAPATRQAQEAPLARQVHATSAANKMLPPPTPVVLPGTEDARSHSTDALELSAASCVTSFLARKERVRLCINSMNCPATASHHDTFKSCGPCSLNYELYLCHDVTLLSPTLS